MSDVIAKADDSVIITGACGLIGKSLVRYLNVIENVKNVYQFDKELGHDLLDESQVKTIFQNTRAPNLINLFAFNDHVVPGQSRGTLFDLPLSSFSDSLNVNLTALFSVCREYAKNNPGGNIINFGASTGIVSARTDMYNGAHKHVGYSVSKAGVIHLSKILAVHFAPSVRVNCISPGGIEHEQSDDFKALYGSHVPLARMCKKNELFPVIKMLCDPQNSYMTGANIVIDGGYTSW